MQHQHHTKSHELLELKDSELKGAKHAKTSKHPECALVHRDCPSLPQAVNVLGSSAVLGSSKHASASPLHTVPLQHLSPSLPHAMHTVVGSKGLVLHVRSALLHNKVRAALFPGITAFRGDYRLPASVALHHQAIIAWDSLISCTPSTLTKSNALYTSMHGWRPGH